MLPVRAPPARRAGLEGADVEEGPPPIRRPRRWGGGACIALLLGTPTTKRFTSARPVLTRQGQGGMCGR